MSILRFIREMLNHGFLLTSDGWTLSPAYDVNPVYFGSGLTLNISETDNSLDWHLAKSVGLARAARAVEVGAQYPTAKRVIQLLQIQTLTRFLYASYSSPKALCK